MNKDKVIKEGEEKNIILTLKDNYTSNGDENQRNVEIDNNWGNKIMNDKRSAMKSEWRNNEVLRSYWSRDEK